MQGKPRFAVVHVAILSQCNVVGIRFKPAEQPRWLSAEVFVDQSSDNSNNERYILPTEFRQPRCLNHEVLTQCSDDFENIVGSFAWMRVCYIGAALYGR